MTSNPTLTSQLGYISTAQKVLHVLLLPQFYSRCSPWYCKKTVLHCVRTYLQRDQSIMAHTKIGCTSLQNCTRMGLCSDKEDRSSCRVFELFPWRCYGTTYYYILPVLRVQYSIMQIMHCLNITMMGHVMKLEDYTRITIQDVHV